MASPGRAAARMAAITPTPAAPAASTSRTRAAVIPPMASTGVATAVVTRRRASRPWRPVGALGRRVEYRTEDDEVRALCRRRPRLLQGVDGGADQKFGAPDRAQHGDGQGVVRALDAVRPHRQSHVHAVVYVEARPPASRGLAERRGQRLKRTKGKILLPELHRAEPALEALLHHLGQGPRGLRPIRHEEQREAEAPAQLVLQSGTPSMGEEAVA